MVVGNLGRFRSARVHDNQAATARMQFLYTPRKARRTHDRSPRRHGITTDADKQLRAIDVRDRHQELVSEHGPSGHHVRQLVNAGGGIKIARLRRTYQLSNRQQRPQVVHGGVTCVKRKRIGPVARADRPDPAFDLIECSLPGDLMPALCGALQGLPDSIRIFMKILQCDGLRADVPAAEDVVAIGFDGRHLPIAVLHDETAHDLA